MKTKTMIVAVVALALLAGMAVFAVANTVETYMGTGNPAAASGTVTARAVINPRLEMTITTPNTLQTVDFGNVEPGTTTTRSVSIEIKSNRQHTLTRVISGTGVTPLGFSTSLPNSGVLPRTASTTHNDIYTIAVPWTTEPGPYNASVAYTVTQQ